MSELRLIDVEKCAAVYASGSVDTLWELPLNLKERERLLESFELRGDRFTTVCIIERDPEGRDRLSMLERLARAAHEFDRIGPDGYTSRPRSVVIEFRSALYACVEAGYLTDGEE